MAVLGFGFSGSGLLVFYYHGVCKQDERKACKLAFLHLLNTLVAAAVSVLLKQGLIVPGSTPLGGLSGGGITSLQTCSQVPLEQQYLTFKMVISYCRETYPGDPYCGGILGYLIKQGVRQNLKTYGNPLAAQKCSDNLFVSVSQLNPLAPDILNPTPWNVSKFSSLDDLAELTGATCFLSCFMAYKPYTLFRGVPVMDGGYTSGYRDFCPPKVSRCIKIASYLVGPNNPTGQPGCNSQTVFPSRTTNSSSSSPRDKALPQQNNWKLPTQCSYDQVTKAITAPPAPGFVPPVNPDIYPGFSPLSPLTVDPCEWQSYSMDINKMNATTIQMMYDTGVKDAKAWLQQNPTLVTG